MKIPRITRDELRERLDRGEDILLLDVRNSEDYGLSSKKLPGAVRIPVEELEGRVDELDRTKEIVVYCT